MARQTEIRLLVILGFVLLGVGLLIWGQQSGKLKIFGDAILLSSDSSPITIDATSLATPSVSSNGQIYEESFDSAKFLNTEATSANWNFEAGEVSLAPGTTSGSAQSLSVADLSGGAVEVELQVVEDLPAGSAIYYALSQDGGTTWTAMVPGQITTFLNPTGDWRWRAVLSRGQASRNPALTNLKLILSLE